MGGISSHFKIHKPERFATLLLPYEKKEDQDQFLQPIWQTSYSDLICELISILYLLGALNVNVFTNLIHAQIKSRKNLIMLKNIIELSPEMYFKRLALRDKLKNMLIHMKK